MRVVSLSTLGFRNLAPGEVELGEGVTLLHGANGAGKTNILEALYMGLAGRSCRTRADRETIAFGEPLCARRGRDRGPGRAPRVPLRRRSRERPAPPGERLSDAGRRIASPSGRRLHAGPAGARQGTSRGAPLPPGRLRRGAPSRACRGPATLLPRPRAAERTGQPDPRAARRRSTRSMLGTPRWRRPGWS